MFLKYDDTKSEMRRKKYLLCDVKSPLKNPTWKVDGTRERSCIEKICA